MIQNVLQDIMVIALIITVMIVMLLVKNVLDLIVMTVLVVMKVNFYMIVNVVHHVQLVIGKIKVLENALHVIQVVILAQVLLVILVYHVKLQIIYF